MKFTDASFRNAQGRLLNAQLWAPDTTPQCVVGIVHGLGEYGGRFAPVAERLVQDHYAVVAYDQQGHGKTGGSLPSFQTLLDDLDSFANHLTSLHERVFLYGQSLGGGIVANYALQKRPSVRGVIASSPLFRPTMKPPAWKLLIARTLGKLWPSMTLGTAVDAHELSHDPEAVQRYLNDPLVHRRVSAALGISMLDAGEWSLKNGDKLAVPMLLMHGSADGITSSECSQQFAKLAGSLCTFKLWDGLYHDLHFETEREQVLRFVSEWISSK